MTPRLSPPVVDRTFNKTVPVQSPVIRALFRKFTLKRSENRDSDHFYVKVVKQGQTALVVLSP